MRIALSDPIVVSLAPPGENRWGYWQFPYLSRLPDQRLLLTHHVAPDTEESYGLDAPAYVSADEGRTWQPFRSDVPEFSRHPTFIAHLTDGECFFIPPGRSYPPSVLRGAAPVGELISYGPVQLYDAATADPVTREMTLLRWQPHTRCWTRECAHLELPGGLLWSRAGGVVANTFLESKPLLDRKGTLITADYRNPVRNPDGQTPTRRGAILLESPDRGRTWRMRGRVAFASDTMYAEPFLAYAPSGELLCTLRTTHGDRITPLYLARSADDGRTWSPPELIAECGVFPNILALACGITVLSFGRPGLWLVFAADRRGREWSHRTTLVEPDPAPDAATCGYSSLEALGANRFLIAYSDFRFPVGSGKTRKAILTREVSVFPGVGGIATPLRLIKKRGGRHG